MLLLISDVLRFGSAKILASANHPVCRGKIIPDEKNLLMRPHVCRLFKKMSGLN